MTIDWAHFTPWSALAGGILLGLATGLFVLANGRIAGISGLLGSLLKPKASGWLDSLLFILGLLLAPWLWLAFAELPVIEMQVGVPGLLLAGLLVGFGARLGAGCTSGHGICGLSRLSPRSLVATLCFMATGFATVFVVRHLLGAGA
ncbi:YeeE/YedE family protein [Pseudomonas sp. MAP12]|uniref:YeeE/YedE family protein n=1 Tax=Geopseudomonas aromaticivorans TaxID=2849492 RepID=A0ABS6N119_9GAMM|nr:YeeE/YedE thiosulfate transporter family protein [Pseudomonas aromaticivorans]MBV2134252.1 YeeE/YedE family protein [Pseudomonas aromaticivorans]